MGCIFTFFMFMFPRFAFFLVWVARPERVDAAFDTFIVPLFGIFLLPFTTLLYVVLYRPGGVSGADWLWLGLAVVLDVINLGGGVVQRDQFTTSRYPAPWVKG
jgi:hypothetical protein